MNDDHLLRLCRQGDQAAWRELVSRYTRKVFGLAYRFAGRVDEAEDLGNETGEPYRGNAAVVYGQPLAQEGKSVVHLTR